MQEIDIELLYNEHFKTVYKYLICLTHSKEIAEDITQETFCKAIEKINTFKGNCKISVWLCEIAKNLWLNECKKNKRNLPFDSTKHFIDAEFNIEEDFLLKQDKSELFKRIHELDSLTKEIFYLKLFGDLSFKEIGNIMGKSEIWARVNFYRGKQKIKESDRNEKGM